jgi:hypothetical protein
MSTIERAAHGRFAPGQSDNPAGRRLGSRSRSALSERRDQLEAPVAHDFQGSWLLGRRSGPAMTTLGVRRWR